jgi:NAD+ synthase
LALAFTKYGDGGVDLSPIADLMKSSIYVSCLFKSSRSILNVHLTDYLVMKTDEAQLGLPTDN